MNPEGSTFTCLQRRDAEKWDAGERHALQYLVNAPLLQNVRSGKCNARDAGMIRLSGVDGATGQWKGTRAVSFK